MKSAGPNDRCPCGSGRKYKDCCGSAGDARVTSITGSGTRESAIAKLLAFAFQPAFDSDHAIAEVIFWGDLIRDPGARDVQRLIDSEDATIKYNSWFLFDWDVEGNGTVADLFLESADARLSPGERQLLQRLARAQLRLYEVEAVDRGRGLRLLDLWTGTRLFVVERTASTQIVTWDLLGARVAPDGLGGSVFEGGLYLYPAEAKERIVAQFRRLHRRHMRRFQEDGAASFFRKHGVVFHHLWLNLVAFPKPPKVVTAEGDPLIFCRAVFDTQHLDQVRDAVRGRTDVHALEDGRVVWRDAAEDGVRDLGTWAFEGQRIVLETTSQERAARGRAWLEALAGDLVRYRATAL